MNVLLRQDKYRETSGHIMRYSFLTDCDRPALLKKYYRRFQAILGAGIAALTGLCLKFPAYMGSHAWVILPFLGYFVASAFYERSRRTRDGIQNPEWQAYLHRQPMMIIVMVIMAISVCVNLYRVFRE
jgi:hypothetical protein